MTLKHIAMIAALGVAMLQPALSQDVYILEDGACSPVGKVNWVVNGSSTVSYVATVRIDWNGQYLRTDHIPVGTSSREPINACDGVGDDYRVTLTGTNPPQKKTTSTTITKPVKANPVHVPITFVGTYSAPAVVLSGYGEEPMIFLEELPGKFRKMIPLDMGPGSMTYVYRFEDRQDVIISIDVDTSGKSKIEFRFSNMRLIDRDHFAVGIDFVDFNGVQLGHVVNGATVRGGGIEYVYSELSHSPTWWEKVHSLRFQFRKNDKSILGGVSF